MKRFLLVVAFVLAFKSGLYAAYPYDSVCEISVKSGMGYNGGSATLVAVSEKQALLLTCQHVCETAGSEAQVFWPSTGEKSVGRVLRVGRWGLDIALVICPRPKDLRPVPIASPNIITSGTITNAGFPGCTGTLEWQQGTLQGVDSDQIYYTCRPIPGMSGGATFDQHGNLIGVIVAYGRDHGYSTSGTQMTHFLSDYMTNHNVTNWSLAAVQAEVCVVPPPVEDMIRAPKDYEEFQLIMEQDYGIVREPIEDPEATEATSLEVHEKHVRKSGTCRPNFRRRLFRRRR